MIETVLQALTHVQEPRLLVCAPSNAAADVIAKRLVLLMPEAARRRQALADTMAAEARAARDGIALEAARAEIIEERTADGQPTQSTQPYMAMLRLNSQSRPRASVPVELLAYCKEDVATDMFTVPTLAELKSKRCVQAPPAPAIRARSAPETMCAIEPKIRLVNLAQCDRGHVRRDSAVV